MVFGHKADNVQFDFGLDDPDLVQYFSLGILSTSQVFSHSIAWDALYIFLSLDIVYPSIPSS